MEEEKIEYTLEDILAAVQYGFNYALNSQHDGKSVPFGNTFQWLMYQKNLLLVPQEFKNKLSEN
jgi:hypothetical protein